MADSVKVPRLVAFLVLLLGIVLVVAATPAAASLATTSTQPSLPATLSGTQVLELPPCGGQSANDCTVAQSWSATLLSPSQAGAWYVEVFGLTGTFTTCGMIAVYSTTITTPYTIPLFSGGSAGTTFYNGIEYASPAITGYPGTGATPYVHYSTADGCGDYVGPSPPPTSTTASSSTASSASTSSSSSSATSSASSASTTQSASSSTSSSSSTLPHGSIYGGSPSFNVPLGLVGGVLAVEGWVMLYRGKFPW